MAVEMDEVEEPPSGILALTDLTLDPDFLGWTQMWVQWGDTDQRVAVLTFIGTSWLRHKQCDWGVVSEMDRTANAEAMITKARLVSRYPIPDSLRQVGGPLHIEIVTNPGWHSSTMQIGEGQ